MLIKNLLNLSKYKEISVIIFGLIVSSIMPPHVFALTAGDVSEKMGQEERLGYLAGVVEGLAYSRWLRDRPDDAGMQCVYRWYYEGKGKDHGMILSWFARHPDKPVGALMHVLVKQECGE